MAGKLKVVLNESGVRELLRSEEMKSICADHASKILERCGSGYAMDTYTGANRVNAMIYAETYQAKASNRKHNTIIKAVKG
jgi:hypothetical protein